MPSATKRIITLILVLACLLTCVVGTSAAGADPYPSQFYLTQLGNGTCTLCSATMLIRSSMYINGSSDWLNVTESGLKPVAWTQGIGLKWNFSYATEEARVMITHQKVNGFTTESLKALLDQHPEGIVFYCGKIPHAVFMQGYVGDTFYCAETVKGYSGKTIPLAETWIGKKYNNDQDKAINNATAYWYVADYQRLVSDYDCTGIYAGTYTCTASSNLRIRSGHGTGYSVVGSIPAGATVTVTKAQGLAESDWAHVNYNGTSGYVSMQYLSLVKLNHRYESTEYTPTCTEKGYSLHVCADCGHSLMENMVEALGHSYGPWTDTDTAGLQIRTCTRCGGTETQEVKTTVMGTVTGNSLRIRENPGTSHKVVGYVNKGDRVEILEQKTVGAAVWGRIDKGWISMSYVKLDEVPEEPPVTEPPVTEPPATEPPVTEPPATEPPVTEPPATEPPVTEPEPEVTTVMGTVTGSSLRIREKPGTSYKTLGFVYRGDRVEILEMTTVNGMTWGRIDKGWVSMKYVELDQAEAPEVPEEPQTRIVTVNASCLRVRSEATTASSIVGYLYRGAKVEILETKDVGGTTWGRTDKGWISMDYVS